MNSAKKTDKKSKKPELTVGVTFRCTPQEKKKLSRARVDAGISQEAFVRAWINTL